MLPGPTAPRPQSSVSGKYTSETAGLTLFLYLHNSNCAVPGLQCSKAFTCFLWLRVVLATQRDHFQPLCEWLVLFNKPRSFGGVMYPLGSTLEGLLFVFSSTLFITFNFHISCIELLMVTAFISVCGRHSFYCCSVPPPSLFDQFHHNFFIFCFVFTPSTAHQHLVIQFMQLFM